MKIDIRNFIKTRRRDAVIVLTLVLACLAPTLATAQNRIHIGLGYNQSYASLESFNSLIELKNEEAEWSIRPFGSIHTPAGITGHLTADLDGIFLEIGYTMRTQRIKAETEQGENTLESHLRYSANTIDLGAAFALVRKPMFRMALGTSLDFGNLRIRLRTTTSDRIQSQLYGTFVNELSLCATGYLHMMWAFREDLSPGIFVRPYFQFALRENDYGPINRGLRPTTGQSDPAFFILDRNSNVGLKVGVYFGS